MPHKKSIVPGFAATTSLFRGFWLVLALALPLAAQALDKQEWPQTDFKTSSIDLNEILSGGPPKDGIPSIDNPSFINLEQAGDWLADSEPVIVLEHAGQARAYPLQILMWHEIVNDKIGDLAVSVTFCPLCNASIVFDRTIDGVEYDFGTTGRLRKSDMLMYDRQTESWWQQFIGEAVIGELTGTTLVQISSAIVSFGTFAGTHPQGSVLSRDTGFERQYGRNPYRGYDNINSSPFLFKGKTDPRLPPMERVLSVRSDDGTLLFALSSLADSPVVNTRFDDRNLAVFSFETMNSPLDGSSIADSRLIPAAAIYSVQLEGKSLTFEFAENFAVDEETGSRWNLLGKAVSGPLQGKSLEQIDGGVHFAFAWLAFDPEAQIFTVEK